MPALTKQSYEAMSEKERQLLLKVVSTDNMLRGMPSFQEWCEEQKAKRFVSGSSLRVRLANLFIRFGWWISGK